MNRHISTSIFFVIFSLTIQSTFAQYFGNFKNNSKNFYGKYDYFIEPGEIKLRTWYHYVLTQKENTYILRQFHPEKMEILSESRYSDKKMKNQTGLNRTFSNDSYFEGLYSNDKKEGVWMTYSYEGDTLGESYFENGSLEGEVYTWYKTEGLKSKRTYSKGKKTGAWKDYYESGILESETNYFDNKQNGDYFLYDSLGTLTTHWVYSNDEIIESVKGEIGEEINPMFGGCEHIEDFDLRQKCANREMYHFIGNNVKYPSFAQKMNMSGRVFLKFVIEKDGRVGDIEVVKGLCESLDYESFRVLSSMPRWNPGYQNGKPVRVYFTIPIIYQLE
ncbi:energy transducer TonB [Arcticibacterium luteifluviistationis]|uniref:TonB C-terminal domain-containing protein n=1 Tax=Arcticibacterium luteifluviistationis TaxID=1784714 RepID=A0A2Z4GDR3_9BACT|nr:energy transducer TonB [Arcticibacterium luteifluviistationis]AWV99270.1 hypothetical protein DJ013_14290 [Arcticibacterium luteifluviistationis]